VKKLIVFIFLFASLPCLAQTMPTNSSFFALSKFPVGPPPASLSNKQLATIEAMAHVSAKLATVWVRAIIRPSQSSTSTQVVRIKVPLVSTTSKSRPIRAVRTTPKSRPTRVSTSKSTNTRRSYTSVTTHGTNNYVSMTQVGSSNNSSNVANISQRSP